MKDIKKFDSENAKALGRIWFCGDLHGHFENLIKAVKNHTPAAIILLGDVQAQKPLHIELADILDLTQIWFIPGNHDTDSLADYDNLFGSKLADRNLHGRVAEIEGLRIAGLGGVFRQKIWMPPEPAIFESPKHYLARCGKGNYWRGGLPLKHRSTIFQSDFQKLQQQRADILVTHEAPSVHPNGFSALDDLGRSLGVARAFHGHHHDDPTATYEQSKLSFEAHAVAYCAIKTGLGTIVPDFNFQ